MKNQEVYIPRPAKAMMAEIESLKAALAVAIAERDALHKNCIKQYDWEELRAKNQSLTTLCAELVEALESIEEYWNGSNDSAIDDAEEMRSRAQNAISKAHATELLKKKE